MKISNLIFRSEDSWAPLFARVFLGLTLFPHGAQKLFGWFGGFGFSGSMGYFTETLHLPWIVAFLVILLESVGAVALITGFATRIMAIGMAGLGIGIMFTSHIDNGFFMNWFGNQAGEGYEYFLLWIGLAISIGISGGGKFSIDNIMFPKENKEDYSFI